MASSCSIFVISCIDKIIQERIRRLLGGPYKVLKFLNVKLTCKFSSELANVLRYRVFRFIASYNEWWSYDEERFRKSATLRSHISKLIRGQKESEFLRRQRGPLRGNSCGALRQQGLKPIKYTSAERSAPLTTSAFNPLGQYTSSMPAVRPTVT